MEAGLYKTLGERDMLDWEQLMSLLDDFPLNLEDDKFTWVLEKSGKYSTNSMYRRLMFRGVNNKRMKRMWRSKLPQKLKVFAWLVAQNKLQTGDNLKKRKWKGDEKCCLCRKMENMDHIFFECHIAKTIWYCFKEALGWDRVPISMTDMMEHWIPIGGQNYHIKLFTLIIVLWGLWTVRNKMAIEKKNSQDLLMKCSAKSSNLCRNGKFS